MHSKYSYLWMEKISGISSCSARNSSKFFEMVVYRMFRIETIPLRLMQGEWQSVRMVSVRHTDRHSNHNLMTVLAIYHWLGTRKALTQLKDVLLRTRRVLSPQTLYSSSTLLVFNGTSLNSDNALLALNSWYSSLHRERDTNNFHLQLPADCTSHD